MHYKASRQPIADIELVSYKGQDPNRKLYRYGYEHFMDSLQILQEDDDLLNMKVELSRIVMKHLATKVAKDAWDLPAEGEFKREIIAIEPPEINYSETSVSKRAEHEFKRIIREGIEFVVALWGKGYTSPVHGHQYGFIHEEMITGKMIVNTFNLMPNGKARLAESKVYESGEIASGYNTLKGRTNMVHNFVALENSISLHYVPEHTRDGRDNKIEVEWFNPQRLGLIQVDAQEPLSAGRIGDVYLIRSGNVPEFGDHYIVITGKPILKPWGLRPQDIALVAPNMSRTLDMYEPNNGLTILKLTKASAEEFKSFHQINI